MDMAVPGIAERPRAEAAPSALRAALDWRCILDYIDAHLDADLGTPALARACRLAPAHFTRLFSAVVGIPPHRYVAYRRLKRARQRMLMSSPCLP